MGDPGSAAAAALPPAPGAYVLWIDLDRPVTLPIPRLGSPMLGPGRYAYCGSARGPGGIRARLARHLRPVKRIHWHVDRLTAAGRVDSVMAYPGGNECALMATLLARDGAAVPIQGFGSSDCRSCAAHLVAYSGVPTLEAFALTPTRATLLVFDRRTFDRHRPDREN